MDDGKSTLIGRLLHDSKTLYEDTLASLEKDSRRVGSAGGAIDFSLLLDGLKAEREQGITIDVAYRYFSTPRRKFIIADCPGHEQYTRNMVTGASTANLAIVLVDARAGVLPQTRRHSFIASLLDIGHIVVAINKMDLVDWSQERVRRDPRRVRRVRHPPAGPQRPLHPDLGARRATTWSTPSTHMPWYRGVPLLDYLETVHIASDRNLIDLRFPVQLAMRQDMSFRGFAGTLASGILRPGAEVMVLPSRQRTRVRIGGDLGGRARGGLPAHGGDGHHHRRDRHRPRRHAGPPAQPAARRPGAGRGAGVDERDAARPPAHLPHQAHDRARRTPR